MHKGYVYFIVDYKTNQVKIGYSTKPEQRLKQLKTGYPGKLEIAKTVPGNPTDEKKYQRVFCHDKICREWFRLSEEIIEFINRKVR